MSALETLRLEKNLIEVLPGEVFKCTNLIELNLDDNFIDDLPGDLAALRVFAAASRARLPRFPSVL